MSWVIVTPAGWTLKPDAPADVLAAFAEYQKSISMDIAEVKT